MLALRRLGTVLIGAWGGALFARLLLDWILGLDDVWVALGVVAGALTGGALALGEARSLRLMEPQERRDAILGWGFVIAAAAVALTVAVVAS